MLASEVIKNVSNSIDLLAAKLHRCSFESCMHVCQSCPLTGKSLHVSHSLSVCSSTVSCLHYVLSPLRLKGKPTDIPDGGKKELPLQPEETSNTHPSDKHTDTHISTKPAVDIPDSSSTPPTHHCDMKTSRLPTLLEEETSDVKTPGPVVREEADGKDDTTEVNPEY